MKRCDRRPFLIDNTLPIPLNNMSPMSLPKQKMLQYENIYIHTLRFVVLTNIPILFKYASPESLLEHTVRDTACVMRMV